MKYLSQILVKRISKLTAVVFVMVGFSQMAFAKEIIRDSAAQQVYDQLIQRQIANPTEVTSFVNPYFGDSNRPELGRLWVTTIYPSAQPKTFCYEFDFRDAKVKEYLCEIYP